MSLGHKLRELRKAKQLTLERLSELSGVEVGTISALEQRNSKRSQYTSALAKGLGVPVDDLYDCPPTVASVVYQALDTPSANVSFASEGVVSKFDSPMSVKRCVEYLANQISKSNAANRKVISACLEAIVMNCDDEVMIANMVATLEATMQTKQAHGADTPLKYTG